MGVPPSTTLRHSLDSCQADRKREGKKVARFFYFLLDKRPGDRKQDSKHAQQANWLVSHHVKNERGDCKRFWRILCQKSRHLSHSKQCEHNILWLNFVKGLGSNMPRETSYNVGVDYLVMGWRELAGERGETSLTGWNTSPVMGQMKGKKPARSSHSKIKNRAFSPLLVLNVRCSTIQSNELQLLL